MSPSSDSRLTELPFLIVSVSLGFHALIKRLHAATGLREDVAVGMGSIFFALCEGDDCIMKDLGARLRMPKGTLSGLVARMEQIGLIERSQCPDDGRAQRVRLTRKARAMEARLRARHARAMQVLQAGMSMQEVATLRRLLDRVIVNLRDDEADSRVAAIKPRRSAIAAKV